MAPGVPITTMSHDANRIDPHAPDSFGVHSGVIHVYANSRPGA